MYDDPGRRRLPHYRGRLLIAALLSCASVPPIVIVLGQILVGLVRDTWHLGCTAHPPEAGESAWICPTGIAYFIPGVMLAVVFAGAGFCVAAVRIVRGMSRRAPDGELRRAAVRDLARLGGAVLLLQVALLVFGYTVPFALLLIVSVVLLSTAIAVGKYGEDRRAAESRTRDG